MIKIKKYKIAQTIILAIVISLIWSIIQSFTAMATPTAPVTLVNHALNQCAEHVILGDECYYCTPIEGWEILDFGQQCPSGYTKTDSFSWSCTVHTPPATPYSECGGANITVALLTPASGGYKPSVVKSNTIVYVGLALIVLSSIVLLISIRKKGS